jgi:hypothetical protein
VIADVEINARRLFRDAGVAGCRVKCIAIRRLCELPRQRMFAPAAADQKDVHVCPISRG